MDMHYDQETIYNYFLDFMKGGGEGMEVTESDLLAAFREAKKQTKYFEEE